MFEPGDLVVYGGTGVCRVQKVGSAPGASEGKLYYTLEPLYQTCVIYAPLSGGRVPIRPVISRAEAEELIDAIPTVVPEVCAGHDLRQLTERYEAAVKSHSCAELLGLSMSIYQKKRDAELAHRRLGQTDERFMKQAENLLFGELAVALGIPLERVPDYIAGRVGDQNQ